MNFEKPITQESNKREVFINKLREEVGRLVEAGRLTQEQADEKIANAEKIEEGHSETPEVDAEIFAIAGISTEAEMIQLLGKRKTDI